MTTKEPDPVLDYLAAFGKAMRDPVAIQKMLDSIAARARGGDADAADLLRKYGDRFRAAGYDIPGEDSGT